MKKELTNMAKKIIEKKVDEVLKEFGYSSKERMTPDIVKMARHFKFRVGESSELPFIEDGFMLISADKENRTICINRNRTPEEKRFVVAHELAHYFLHYSDSTLKESIKHRKHIKGKNQDENDADYFAACILMPKDIFLKEYNVLRNKGYDEIDIIAYLQDAFKTPEESIQRRIKEVTA